MPGRSVESARTMLATDRSARLMERARGLMPGGVNSPVRAFRSVGGDPLFMERGEGPRVFDADGNSFVDYVMSYGPLVLGHADPGRDLGDRGDLPQGDDLRRADGARDRASRPRVRGRALRRDGPHGQLGHRGDDERDPAGPRLHRAREDPQVRRQLPRPRRRPARLRRLGRRDARPTRQPRRDEGGGEGHHRPPLQRPPGRPGAFRGAGRGVRRRDPGAGGGEHGLRAARRTVTSKACAT